MIKHPSTVSVSPSLPLLSLYICIKKQFISKIFVSIKENTYLIMFVGPFFFKIRETEKFPIILRPKDHKGYLKTFVLRCSI